MNEPRRVPPSRRSFLALAGATTAAGIVDSSADLSAATLPGPDADLIQLCSDYIEALDAYDREGGFLESELDHLWHAVEAIEERLDALTATTLDGIAAKARVALRLARQPSGREDFSRAYVGDWPEQVVRDLLRVSRAT